MSPIQVFLIEIIVNEYNLLIISDLKNLNRRLPIVFFIVTLYNEFNKFQFGTVISGIKTLAKDMLKSVCVAIWSSDAWILERFIYN